MPDVPDDRTRTRSPSLTRRRALALGAAAGLGSLFRLPAPLARAAAGGPGPRGFSLDVPGAAFRGGRVTGVLRAPGRFDLLGVTGPGVAGSGLEVRVRPRGGPWSRWVPLSSGAGHGPDRTARRVPAASDPIWTGAARELQLRSRRPLGGLRVDFVAAGDAPRLARAAASGRAAQLPGTPPPIIGRDVWNGGRSKPREAPEYGEVQVAFVHHTVTANDYGPAESAAIVLSICKYHRDTNGWNDIGYNFLVDRHGQVFEGREGGIDAAVIGAQAQGYNRVSTGVAVIGTHGAIPISEPAMQATAHLLGWKMSLHGVPTEGQATVLSGGGSVNRYPHGAPVAFERISGHRDADRTACPGNALYAQLPELRRRATALAGPVVQRAQLVMTARRRAVQYGSDLQLEGGLRTKDGLAAAATRVSIQKRGKTDWITIAHVTTADDGTWRAAVPLRRDGAMRARARLADGTLVVSRVTNVSVIPVISARAASRRARAGSSVLVTGSVQPIGPVKVRVERQTRSGRWVHVADVPVRTRRPGFAVRIPLRRAALYRITARTATAKRRVQARQVHVRAVRRLVRGGTQAET